MKGNIIIRKLPLYVSIIISVLMCSTVFANLMGSPGAGWQSWTTANLNENNYPYWDGASWDGSNKNVGNYLTNTGGFSGSTDGPGAIDYWGFSDGSADPNFYFSPSYPALTAVIKFEIAGFKDYNKFGWYEVDSGYLHELYDGSAGTGDSVSFSPGEKYGYYLTSKEGNTFYTESYRNLIDTGYQHFAVFLDPSDFSFWIGVEDLVSAGCWAKTDRDYNDFGVKVNPVPEPATMLLLGSGLVLLAGIGRRNILKKKK